MGKVKKLKNVELNKNEQLKNVVEKSKDNIKKAKDANPAPAVVTKTKNPTDIIKKRNKLNKNKKLPEEQTSSISESKSEAKELDAKILAKIEKKNAKKLAKKLKKKELKAKQKDSSGIPSNSSNQQNGQEKDVKNTSEQQEETNKSLKNLSKNPIQKNLKDKKVIKDKKKRSKQWQEDVKDHNPRDPAVVAATIFIGNLPVATKRIQIVKLLAKFGSVQSIRLRTAAGQIIFKHKQRKLAGSLNAYVVLENAEIAQKALQLNGTEFKGNHLRVTPADAQKTQSGHDPKRTIFLGNLKYSANERKLHEIFSNCGEIDYIRCLGNGKNGCNGVAYVCFKSPEAVGLALELNETLLDERPIHVERYSIKKLGAKEAREKQAALTQKQNNTGAKKRIDAKHDKNGMKFSEKKKKSEFRGVKTTVMKNKKQKKKPNKEMKGLAKKIAPTIKKPEKN